MENGDLLKETSVIIFIAKNEFYEEFWPRKRYNMSYTLMTIFDKKCPREGTSCLETRHVDECQKKTYLEKVHAKQNAGWEVDTHTLKVESFAGRHFRDFTSFLVVRES